MKVPITLVLCAAGAIACAHDKPPRAATTSVAPTAQGRVETAQVSEYAPPAPGIPTNGPPVAPPAAPLAPPPDQTPITLTPASGVGAPRTASAQLVPTELAHDKPASAQDQESIREIRALLAADQTLASIAPRVTIVARNGRVWLRGQVNTAEQRAGIERAALRAAGVIGVNNELVVME